MDEQEITIGLFDIEEVHPNCTVKIWRNSTTGEKSLGWFDNDNPPVDMTGINHDDI